MQKGRQLIVLARVVDLEQGALLGTSSSPLLRVPLEAVLYDTPALTPLSCNASAHHFTVPGPVTTPSMDADQLLLPPQCWHPFVHHLRDEPAPTCDESAASSAAPTYRSPSPALLERLSVDQRLSFSKGETACHHTCAKSRLICAALVGRRYHQVGRSPG